MISDARNRLVGNVPRVAPSKGPAAATFGSKNAGDLPVDAHELIALCAPRLTFISYGVPEKGDAKWLDHQGSYMAAVAAGPVFRLLGAKDLGTTDDYRTEKMPAVNVSMLGGQLAWRQHDGGHTDGPNWRYFIPWADGFFNRPYTAVRAAVAADQPAARTDANSLLAHEQCWRRRRRAGSTFISKATRLRGGGGRPIIRRCWRTGSRISSAGTRRISVGRGHDAEHSLAGGER